MNKTCDPSNTAGRGILALLISPSRTAYRVAKSIGARPDSVYRWLSGKARPEPHFRDALERVFQVPASSWYTSEERAVAFGE